ATFDETAPIPTADEVINAEAVGSPYGSRIDEYLRQNDPSNWPTCPDGSRYDPTLMYIVNPCFDRTMVDPDRPDRAPSLEGMCPAGYNSEPDADGWCYRNDLGQVTEEQPAEGGI